MNEHACGREVALVIDPRCGHLIGALQGGYMFRRVHGHVLEDPEPNAHREHRRRLAGRAGEPRGDADPARAAGDHGPAPFRPAGGCRMVR